MEILKLQLKNSDIKRVDYSMITGVQILKQAMKPWSLLGGVWNKMAW